MKNRSVASKFQFIIFSSVAISVIFSSIVISMVLLERFNRNVLEKDMLHIKGIAGTVKGLLDQAVTLNQQLSVNPRVSQTIIQSDQNWETRITDYNRGRVIGTDLTDKGGDPFLIQAQRQYPFVELFFVQDNNGDQTARSFGPLGHRGQRWWFRKMVNNEYRPFLSKSYYSMTGNKPVTSIFHSIRYHGKIIGIMGMDINFEAIQMLISNYLKSKDLSAIVVDNKGVIIAHPDKRKLKEIYNLRTLTRKVLVTDKAGNVRQDRTGYHMTRMVKLNWSQQVSQIVSKVLDGETGFTSEVMYEGASSTIYYEPVPIVVHEGDTANYGVLMIRNLTAFTKVKIWLCVFVFAFVVCATVILLAVFQFQFRRKILRPLEILSHAMDTEHQDSGGTIRIDTGDEFEKLSEAYNRMRRKIGDASCDLQRLNEKLEDRVAARTKEIEQTNRRLQKDIEERQRVEAALRESEDRYRKIFEAAPDAITIIRLQDQSYLDVNQAFYLMTGFEQNEILENRIQDVPIFEDSSGTEIFEKNLLKNCEFNGLEVGCRNKSGQNLSVLTSARRLRYGEEECLVVIFTDITERKNIEAALKESEEKYRLLTENANDAIFIVQDGKILFPNPKAVELGRYLGGHPENASYFNYIHKDDQKMIIERHLKRISGEPLPQICSFRLVTDSNEELWVELNDVAISWGGRPAILSFLRDITTQKKLETQMEKAERMDAIGTLAGGIAHNFNNLLMGIQGNLSLIFMEGDAAHPHHEELKSIERCVENGANLTKQLLGFARGGKYMVKPLNPNQIVQETAKLFGQSKKEIKLHGSYQKSIWTINADQGQIELVLLNIYVNAAQAMTSGGDIYISTENKVFSESDAALVGIKPGKYVKISIMDTGTGISEPVLDKIFEPFFTTKDVGEGTGLGLASAFGIVKNHGGFIDAQSTRGEGATFHVFLPATDTIDSAEEASIEELAVGSETILIIDDEDMIVDVCQSMLHKLGYQVMVARGGRVGIDLYRKEKDNIALVILDIIMPDMEGGRVYDEIKVINPQARVLVASGCSINQQITTILEKGAHGFLQKPFKLKELSLSIREIIGLN